MPSIINLLPDSVANQIAAGEVIQRPASVVKELMENAIDAGSNAIKLIIKDAGKTLIQVIDNGKGMSDTDARLCFERHATSKINNAEDLFRIKTMGFRGEALAAISAISHVELRTRQEDSNIGTRVVLEGSSFVSQDSVSCAKGSSFEIKNLFFNTPARRNFLKSDAIEYKHIVSEFERVALSFPNISFYLYNNEQEIYALERTTNAKQRIANYFDNTYNHKLVGINESTQLFRISGYLSKPEFCRKTKKEQFIFVNNRFIKSQYINNAIVNAYSHYISTDFFPSYFLYIDIDPSKIDINIHPTKTEIKFEDEQTIWAIINASVRKSIGAFANVPTIDFEQNKAIDIPHITKDTVFKMPEINVDKTFNPFDIDRNKYPNKSNNKDIFKDRYGNAKNWETLYQKFEQNPTETETQAQAIEETTVLSSNKYLLLDSKIIVAKLKSGLALIHIKRAIERIYFDDYYANFQNNKNYSNQLIFPIIFNLSDDKLHILKEIEADIKQMGFNYEVNVNEICIKGIPENIKEIDCEDIFLDSINNHIEQQKDIHYERIVEISKTLAKRAASHKKLNSPEETENIIAKLFSSSQPEYSPNKEKIIQIISYESINDYFI